MKNFGHLRPGECRAPACKVLPDGRHQIQRFFEIANKSEIITQLAVPYGTLDGGTAITGWSGLRLIAREVVDDVAPKGQDSRPLLVLSYEEIPATGEIQVGGNMRITLEDGREAIEANFLQFSSDAYVPATVAVTTAPGDASAYLQKAEQSNDGTLRRIKRTYVYAGIIATDERLENNGKLSFKTITSVKTVPTTPAGYILTDKPTQNPNGLPIYTYTYGKGEGVIRKVIQQRDGGLQLESWTSLGTAYDSGTMKPAGILLVKDDVDVKSGKQFTVTCIQSITGGDPTSGLAYSHEVEVEFEYPGRAKAYTKSFSAIAADGTGFTAYAHDLYRAPPVRALLIGTAEVSYQTSATIGSLVYPRWAPTDWAAYEAVWEGHNSSPKSVVEPLYRYRTEGSAVTFTAAHTMSGGGTVDVTGLAHSCMGMQVFGLSSGSITVDGGPAAPDGNTYTLHATVGDEPAFIAEDGTKYWRRTIIYATIPAQAALPV